MYDKSVLPQWEELVVLHIIWWARFSSSITSHRDGGQVAFFKEYYWQRCFYWKLLCYWAVTSGTLFCGYIDAEKRCEGKKTGVTNHVIYLKLLFFYKVIPVTKMKGRAFIGFTKYRLNMKQLVFSFFYVLLKDKWDALSFWTVRAFSLGDRCLQQGMSFCWHWKDASEIVWALSPEALWELFSISLERNREYDL